MRPYALLYFYRRRLRVHLVQELLAGIGIAVAVALVLSTFVAEGSIAGSTRAVVRAVVGPADLQLRARSPDGLREATLGEVERLPGVGEAAPLLEQPARITGRDGRWATVELAGADISLATLDGLAHTLPISALSPGGIGLTRAAAAALHVGSVGGYLPVELRGRRVRLKVTAILGRESAGALSEALAGVMPLASLQSLSGLDGRLSRVLVRSAPGRRAQVRAELARLANGRIDLDDGEQDVRVLGQALRPSDQASAFFAGVAAVVGLLFAFTAMLLTVPERRRAIADLRLVGIRRGAIVQMVLFQALVLGLAASAIGVLAGYGLSRWVLHQSTGYLAEAFTLGTGTVVTVTALALSFLGGVLATCLACSVPLADLRRGRRLDAVYAEQDGGGGLAARAQRRLAVAALVVLAGTWAAIATWPSLSLPASALLAIATVLSVPFVLSSVVVLAHAAAERLQGLTVLPVALASLKATTLRSLVLAATGAVAIFGSIALGGARGDLLRGIEGFSRSYTADAPLWVINPDDNQAVQPIGDREVAARIARVPGVSTVYPFQGTFVDLGDRRAWVIARPPGAAEEVLASQTLDGRSAIAARRLSEGGWAVVSAQLASALHARVGGPLALPTPSGPATLRLAATTTNLAWSPGAIFLGDADFARLWAERSPSAFGVRLTPGADPLAVARGVRAALGPSSGLEVSTARTRERRIDTLTSEGLGRLGEIATLLTLAAILAMAVALASSIWQRRRALAGLRLAGVKPRRLRQILLTESLLMLGAGCLTGAVFGLLGEVVIDRYLRRITGFPVADLQVSGRPLGICALVLASALALVAAPAWLASRASPSLALGAQQ